MPKIDISKVEENNIEQPDENEISDNNQLENNMPKIDISKVDANNIEQPAKLEISDNEDEKIEDENVNEADNKEEIKNEEAQEKEESVEVINEIPQSSELKAQERFNSLVNDDFKAELAKSIWEIGRASCRERVSLCV